MFYLRAGYLVFVQVNLRTRHKMVVEATPCLCWVILRSEPLPARAHASRTRADAPRSLSVLDATDVSTTLKHRRKVNPDVCNRYVFQFVKPQTYRTASHTNIENLHFHAGKFVSEPPNLRSRSSRKVKIPATSTERHPCISNTRTRTEHHDCLPLFFGYLSLLEGS